MSETKKVSVKIQGREYVVNCTEDEEYVKKLAYYVNKKIEQISNANPSLDSVKASVLSALNMADELFKAVTTIEQLKAKTNSNVDLKTFSEVEKIQKEELKVEDSETSLHK